jgi:hypothetical protein
MLTRETPAIQIDRAFVRPIPRWSAKEQEKAVIKAGCRETKVYLDGRSAENFDAVIKAARAGEVIALSGGLRVLGDSRKTIVAAVNAIAEKGAVLYDVGTGDRSDRHGVRMLNRAIAMLHGELSMGDRAEIIGSMGGEAHAEAIRKARMPKEEARMIWLDQRISTAEAVKRMGPHWSKPTAQRAFGPSGRPKGPLKAEKARYSPAFVRRLKRTEAGPIDPRAPQAQRALMAYLNDEHPGNPVSSWQHLLFELCGQARIVAVCDDVTKKERRDLVEFCNRVERTVIDEVNRGAKSGSKRKQR